MRKPSIKTLARVFDNPKQARAVFEMTHAELAAHPVGAAYIGECHRHPKWSDVRLRVLNSLDAGLHGVEYVASAKQTNGYSADEYAEYLNTGDSYAPTVIYWRGSYRVQSVGDFVETQERNNARFA